LLCLLPDVHSVTDFFFTLVIDGVVNTHIHNQLPIFLLDLKNMQLVHRSSLTTLLIKKTTKYKEYCISQVAQESIRHCTENWIKKETSYAILSHRWLSGGELAFSDISTFADHKHTLRKLIKFDSPTNGADILNEVISLSMKSTVNTKVNPAQLRPNMKQSYKELFPADQAKTHFPSFEKLIIFCWISTRHFNRFVWFDSGCINKSSSAELEESIRSMFNWYSKSKVCIVHLADTTDVSSLRRDQWFTRGWTLQELLAPKSIKFFGKSWEPLTSPLFDDDDKDTNFNSKHHLWSHISDITGIAPKQIFTFKPAIDHARDALVWLSKRQTTRVEDMAYCLIGLSGIPLSIAYGEGEMAFYRLQVEIHQRTPDMGLFVWKGQSAVGNSMLAARPDSFSFLTLRPLSSHTLTDDVDRSYSLTTFGLRISLLVYRIPADKWSVDNTSRDPEITLTMAKLRPITVKLQTRKDYDCVELAFLGRVDGEKEDLAILLGFKDGQWKRISMEHIMLSRPSGTALQTRFIR
jgi:hypothetical protein